MPRIGVVYLRDSGEVEVDQPLMTVDRQMGLVIIAPEGKEAKTIFKRMSYDEKRDQSVVHCKPCLQVRLRSS